MVRVGPSPAQCLRAFRWAPKAIRDRVERFNEAMWRLEAKAAGWE